MARLSSPPLSTSTSDQTSTNLNILLTRLQSQLLPPSGDATPISQKASTLLLHSPQHRTRVLANVEYARTLLLQLEHQASSIKIQSRKQAAQADLLAKRKLIKRLRERVEELGREGEALGSDDDDEDDGEDLLRTGQDNTTGTNTAEGGPLGTTISKDGPTTAPETLDRRKVAFAVDEASTAPMEGLRNRRGQPTESDSSTSALQSTERLLGAHSATQETLTSSLLSLSQQLKAQSFAFASSLEDEKTLLDRAGEGLEKNTSGMEVAGKKMGVLRRMSEGRGWWGRILMYAWIFGLWVAVILLVFVGPKLRF